MPHRTLVAYFSLSVNTRRLAEEIAAALGADLEEIREVRPRRGIAGVFRALFDTLLRRDARLLPPVRSAKDYEVLVLGGPIWAGHLAAPVRTFARLHAAAPRRVALFCTQGGRGAEGAFAELQGAMDRPHGAVLAVDAAHLAPEAHADALRRFVLALQPERANGVIPARPAAA